MLNADKIIGTVLGTKRIIKKKWKKKKINGLGGKRRRTCFVYQDKYYLVRFTRDHDYTYTMYVNISSNKYNGSGTW